MNEDSKNNEAKTSRNADKAIRLAIAHRKYGVHGMKTKAARQLEALDEQYPMPTRHNSNAINRATAQRLNQRTIDVLHIDAIRENHDVPILTT